MAYDTGDVIELVAKFRDPHNEDALIDPDTVKFVVKDPADIDTEYPFGGGQVNKDSTGVYSLAITDTDLAGLWHYRVESTGTGQAAREGTFTIKESGF